MTCRIGLFDSGIGGLSVLSEVRRLLPSADLVYIADQAHAPYGELSLAEVQSRAETLTEFLLDAGCTCIVVACNTASAAALHHLRELHPGVEFVGMEPAVKPAAAISATGVIGVLATTATFQGKLFSSVVDRLADGVTVLPRPCVGWAMMVEEGVIEGQEAEAAVRREIEPLLDAGADTLVLACTHYPFLRATIEAVAGPNVKIIDPSAAVAKQVARVVGDCVGAGSLDLRTTGSLLTFVDRVASLGAVNLDRFSASSL